MPGKIVHIALKVNDLESSTRFYEEVFGFRQVTTHDGGNGHVSRHMTDGTIDLALMVYESETAKEATLSGPGPCIHHWARKWMTSRWPRRRSGNSAARYSRRWTPAW